MNYRKFLITTLTFLGGIYFFLEFVLPAKLPEVLGGFEFGKYHSQISNGFIAVGSVAFALGLINLFYVHGSRIIFARKGAINSAALLISLFLMMYLTVNEWVSSEKMIKESARFRNLALFSETIKKDTEINNRNVLPIADRTQFLADEIEQELDSVSQTLEVRDPDVAPFLYEQLELNLKGVSTALEQLKVKVDSEEFELTPFLTLSQSLNRLSANLQQIDELIYRKSVAKLTYEFVYKGFFIPLGSAMFSLLGFYIISAGYRAFRIRSAESALMMIAAVVVMLGQIPFYIYISDHLPEIRLWLLEYPSAAAFRAVKFGAAIAGLYMAIRMWFSIETTSFVDEEGEGKI